MLLTRHDRNTEDNAVLEASTSEEDSSTDDDSVIRSKTIDVTTNSTSTKMTPQDVYENYVNAVVLVYNQGDHIHLLGPDRNPSPPEAA